MRPEKLPICGTGLMYSDIMHCFHYLFCSLFWYLLLFIIVKSTRYDLPFSSAMTLLYVPLLVLSGASEMCPRCYPCHWSTIPFAYAYFCIQPA